MRATVSVIMSGFGGGRGGGARVKKVMTQPISLIFRFLQNVSRPECFCFGQQAQLVGSSVHPPRAENEN